MERLFHCERYFLFFRSETSRRAGREPLAAVRVNPIGKGLHDLDGAVIVHPVPCFPGAEIEDND